MPLWPTRVLAAPPRPRSPRRPSLHRYAAITRTLEPTLPKERFESLQETSGNWMVWDHTTGAVARLGGIELRNQNKHRCEIARDILKRIFNTGLHADAGRQGG